METPRTSHLKEGSKEDSLSYIKGRELIMDSSTLEIAILSWLVSAIVIGAEVMKIVRVQLDSYLILATPRIYLVIEEAIYSSSIHLWGWIYSSKHPLVFVMLYYMVEEEIPGENGAKTRKKKQASKIYIDNKSAIALAKNRTRFIMRKGSILTLSFTE